MPCHRTGYICERCTLHIVVSICLCVAYSDGTLSTSSTASNYIPGWTLDTSTSWDLDSRLHASWGLDSPSHVMSKHGTTRLGMIVGWDFDSYVQEVLSFHATRYGWSMFGHVFSIFYEAGADAVCTVWWWWWWWWCMYYCTRNNNVV